MRTSTKKRKNEFLFLLYALLSSPRAHGISDVQEWYACFFDKKEELTADKIRSLLVRLGLGNILHYRSSRGYTQPQFVASLFLEHLGERFRDRIPVEEDQIKEFFTKLSLSNVKLLEQCSKKDIPLLEKEVERVTQTSRLIVEESRSYFAISPFALDKIRELIVERKLKLTERWKKIFDEMVSSFVEENYLHAELKMIFEEEGAYCWKIRYAESPESEPINVGILLAPYIFKTTAYSTIIDEMRRHARSQLNLIFLLKETFPTVIDSFRYVDKKNLVFLLDEKGEKFYVVEKSSELSDEDEMLIDCFLLKFLPVLEGYIKVDETWSSHLKDRFENLEYLNKYPRLVRLRIRISHLELKLRNTIRRKLKEAFGEKWRAEVGEKLPKDVERWEKTSRKRVDKREVRDFLDGATLGDLVRILRTFSKEFNIDKKELGFLDLITQHRAIFEHPIRNMKSDVDERTYNKIKPALDYIENVICGT